MNADDVVADVKSSMTDKRVRRYSEPGRNGRRVRRPEEIMRDVRGLKLRQRVSLVLGDQLLKDELEQTIRNSTINGVTRADTIRTYQDFLIPQVQPNFVNLGGGNNGSGMAVLPVNDIKGSSTLDYSKGERQTRNKLAAVYRLIDLLGWSESIFNHISARSSKDKEEFLLNPFGLLFSEVTSSSLIKCDLEGNVLDGGSTNLGLNKAGFILHSTIHEARPDLNCVIHVHTPDVVAISSMKCGFLRISQESLVVGDVSYHDYWGILVNEEEKESIKNDLGPENEVMFLRNHGVVVCGKTMESAFHKVCTIMEACAAQVKAMAAGLDNLIIISEEAFQQVQELRKNSSKVMMCEDGKPQLSLDELFFEAYMRWMDSQGYRTGYCYQIPDLFISTEVKKFPESQVPPQVTSDRTNPYQNYYDANGPSMGRGNTHRNRFKWLNNPVQGTQYKKEFVEREEPEIKPPVLDEEQPPVMNGHVEENVTTQVSSSSHNDTKVVTKTTLVTETKVITEISGGNNKGETVTVINGTSSSSSSSHDTSLATLDEKNEKVEEEKTSPEVVITPTKNGSTQEIPGENVKSPNKVKKQKSFKKALMKKFKKEEK